MMKEEGGENPEKKRGGGAEGKINKTRKVIETLPPIRIELPDKVIEIHLEFPPRRPIYGPPSFMARVLRLYL